MTITEYARLRELESLESDGVRLTAEENAELRELLVREEQAFMSGGTGLILESHGVT